MTGGDRNEKGLCMIRELDMTVQAMGNEALCQTDVFTAPRKHRLYTDTQETR